MRKIIIPPLFFVMLLGWSGCSITKHLSYTVSIVNTGSELIWVDAFKISDGENSTFGAGSVNPYSTTSVSPFYQKPFKQIQIGWSLENSAERKQNQVALDLPKEFTKKWGRYIDFYIYPKENRIEVVYKVVDSATGQLRSIRK